MSQINLPISGMGVEKTVIDTNIEPTVPITPTIPVDEPSTDTTDVVEIDGVDYTLDANGNAVKDGVVFKTKEELSSMVDANDPAASDDDDEGIDLNGIAKELNLEFQDDGGQPVTFEPTKEGLVSFVQAVYESGTKATAASAREQMINSYPALESAINYITVHGSLEGYEASTVDYNSLSLDKNNQNQLISIVRKSRESKGDTEAEINKFVNAIVADNSLYEIAESSLNHLKTISSNKDQDLARQAQEVERRQAEQYEQYIGAISNSIKQGVVKLGDKEVRIPVQFKITNDEGKVEVRSKEQFLDYMLKEREYKLADGNTVRATQFEVDKYMEQRQMGYNKDVYDAMRLFTNGDLSSIVDKSVETRRVGDIKNKLRLVSGKSASTHNAGGKGIAFPVKQQIDHPIN